MSDTPTPPSWAEVPRATVRWSLARVDGDTTDVAVGDKVTLQPAPAGIAVVDPLDPNPVSIILEPHTYKVRGDGALVDDQGDMAAVLAVDDPRVATPGGRSVQWIARHERGNGVIRFPAAAGATVELSRWVAATAPEPTQRSWAEQLVGAAEDVEAAIDAALDASGSLVGIGSVAGDAGDIVVTLTDGTVSRVPMPESVPGREVELQTSATHVQWRYTGDADWTDLVPLDLITGEDGDDGLSVELRTTATHVQWRLVGGTWADLVALSALVGPAGPPNSLSVGTVTTGAPGSAAAASISGTAPSQVLNLTIPRGETGAVSAWEYYAAGRPDVVGTLDAAALAWRNAAPSGSTFYSTDGPQGAWVWRKRGASWVCVEGDTGWRNIASLLDSSRWVNGALLVRRIGDTVHWGLVAQLTGGNLGALSALNLLTTTAAGFGSSYNGEALDSPALIAGAGASATFRDRSSSGNAAPSIRALSTIASGTYVQARMTYPASAAWPTTLPGSPA